MDRIAIAKSLVEVAQILAAPMTPQKLEVDLKRAHAAATKAAKDQIKTLQKQGPAWEVKDDFDSKKKPDYIQDVMGMSQVSISGRNMAFLTNFKNLIKGNGVNTPTGRVYVSKGNGGGYTISFFLDSIRGPETQYMSVNKKATEAGAESLKSSGWIKDFNIQSRMD